MKILRQEAAGVGLKDKFSIMDSDDCYTVVSDLALTTDKQEIRRIQNAISLWKNGLVDPEDRYRLTFQVKNVFDTSFASAITSGGPGGSFRYIIPREADRYYGLTGRVNF